MKKDREAGGGTPPETHATAAASPVVVVTGVSGGLGSALAAGFRERNWRVIGVDRRGDADRSFVDRMIVADISRSDEMERLLVDLQREERIDALVNNAALQVNRRLIDTTDAEWEAVMNTNVRSAFQLIRGLHSKLTESRGAVVNIGSVHSIATSESVAAYAVSKGALAALTRTSALELAALGIRCNAVLPGALDTQMLREGLSRRDGPGGADAAFAQLVSRTPLGFLAIPEQVVPTVVFLADGNQSSYITGQTVVVDGGATLRLGTE